MKVVKILLTALVFSFMASCASTSESGNGGPLNDTEKEFVESLNNYKLTVISSPKILTLLAPSTIFLPNVPSAW